MLKYIKQQAKELVVELKRVNWPSKGKVFGGTYFVAAVFAFVGLFLWVTDWVIASGISRILKSC